MAKIFLLILLLASGVQQAMATSLGSGKILSHVGESLLINIDLLGADSKGIHVYQVKNEECRSSVIGTTAHGCDAIYEKPLAFSIRQRADGSSFLRVAGGKADEFFYHILIKLVSSDDGEVFRAFDFLPEFAVNQNIQAPLADQSADTSERADKSLADVLRDKELSGQDGKAGLTRQGGEQQLTQQKKHNQPGELNVKVRNTQEKNTQEKYNKRSRAAARAETISPAENKSKPRLQIKKSDEYVDEIHALRNENAEIEAQIELLEKHIALLKEVIRLKHQTGDAAVPAASVAAPVGVPVSVVSLPENTGIKMGVLRWIALVGCFVLLGLIGWLYKKQRRLQGVSYDGLPVSASYTSINEIKPLDLTGYFHKPR